MYLLFRCAAQKDVASIGASESFVNIGARFARAEPIINQPCQDSIPDRVFKAKK